MFGGTFAAKGGIRPASRFEFELEDPVLKRKIRHGYDVIDAAGAGLDLSSRRAGHCRGSIATKRIDISASAKLDYFGFAGFAGNDGASEIGWREPLRFAKLPP